MHRREPVDDLPFVDELLDPSDGHPVESDFRYMAISQVQHRCLTGFFAYLQNGHGRQRDASYNMDPS